LMVTPYSHGVPIKDDGYHQKSHERK
jgi:hypothetical protein